MLSNKRRAIALVIAATSCALCSSPSLGDGLRDPRHVRWYYYAIGAACQCGTRSIYEPISLNACGEIVGKVVSSTVDSCQDRPFVWTYCPNSYGFSYGDETDAPGLTLTSLMENETRFGSALDISDFGYVGGWLGSDASEEEADSQGGTGFEGVIDLHVPFVWNLNDYATPTEGDCGRTTGLQLGDDVHGETRGVNHVSGSPTFVGVTYVYVSETASSFWTPFRWDYDPQSLTILVDLPLVSGDASA